LLYSKQDWLEYIPLYGMEQWLADSKAAADELH
jgi:hypothetical protein